VLSMSSRDRMAMASASYKMRSAPKLASPRTSQMSALIIRVVETLGQRETYYSDGTVEIVISCPPPGLMPKAAPWSQMSLPGFEKKADPTSPSPKKRSSP
jgi:hypothetical protein